MSSPFRIACTATTLISQNSDEFPVLFNVCTRNVAHALGNGFIYVKLKLFGNIPSVCFSHGAPSTTDPTLCPPTSQFHPDS